MSDIVLLYLFTRLDVIGTAAGAGLFVLGIAGFVLTGFAASEGEWDLHKRYRGIWIAVFAAFALVAVLTPTKQDMAIIVGGKIALDASRTDTAKEISQEVLDAIRSQLKKAKE